MSADHIDDVLLGAAVLREEYDDFDARAALERIAGRVLSRASTGPGAPLPAATARRLRAEQRLRALSADILRDEAAVAAMGLLVDDGTTIEPYGALAFACLLHLTDRAEAARFWWQFAAGAGSPAAAHCLYLHHLQYGEPHDAGHWRRQTEALLASGERPVPPCGLHPIEQEPLLPRPRSGPLSADSVRRAVGPLSPGELSGLADVVRRLAACHDADFGTIVRPDPVLAAAGCLPCRPDGTSRPA
ncbi:hypothetical protein DT019_02005 [Streptomyces sp. SDr-06]|uniref:hypothetical protein n=1 Tax=Streptomyces sp. SDr-06 TaxID=2267702 RepID=UPI000DE81DA0|nr:hypothetical protein [Streptomyces sp. SDr-06]RCH70293.1 hypothetical protein DT019_02005 [Streptomyces sp. SDr-06]